MDKFIVEQHKEKDKKDDKYEYVENLPEGKIDQSIADYAKRYRIKIPEISIILAYTRHTTPEDATHMMESLRRSDIIIPESAGWEYSDFWLQTIGEKSSNRAEKSFETEVMRSQDGMKKDFVYIDLDKKELEKAKKNLIPVSKIMIDLLNKKPPFENALLIFKKCIEEGVHFQVQRELKILKNLAPRVITAVKESNLLKNKKNIEVFIYLGSFHTFIGKQLKKRGEKLDIIFPEKPYVYEKNIEIERKIRFDLKVTRQELVQAFFDYLQQLVFEISLTDQDEAVISQTIAKSITEEDIRKLYESSSGENIAGLRKSVFELIRKLL
ncbi:hypothetical protein CO033_01795 [Candidatus Nomurabacteria bacterium CG_4_9_14_0_2_um_filter_32_10]|uniref:Uncharacterized protein n=3 Tax=Candidatus Nomuraibacteriota TaxID=1752729 RepID=A0A2H0CHK2_9BACT|nr:MAG: hypothetical protein COW91_02625 [Candidatus Nomurabacteria bacterium CG22_combo_CG10-13_8_21_14_all_32_8]PIZ86172.1 MAG: hypothetical protein COX94_00965 [Candidatus Nomurabacteria bacterium CG_4_10_14_0_2_um_filter_33_9]PJC49399.1 MAG: hypothetical protein CO033_01795 [Candidatus Nomurabacteria bacterium CG_4_9_14_0_2_um_filter_32_10]